MVLHQVTPGRYGVAQVAPSDSWFKWLRPDSRLTLCELGALDAMGAPGVRDYFC